MLSISCKSKLKEADITHCNSNLFSDTRWCNYLKLRITSKVIVGEGGFVTSFHLFCACNNRLSSTVSEDIEESMLKIEEYILRMN